jgi:hypothetical protein
MPRVNFVKKARKDNPAVKAGESYYWWKFRFGGKQYSKMPPARAQLTQSEFLSTLYDLEDGLSDRFAHAASSDELETARDDLVSEIQELLDETKSRLENMPEHLQDTSDSGMMLQERIDGLQSWIDDLESVDLELDEDQVGTVAHLMAAGI